MNELANTYEVHITVKTNLIPSFRQHCQELGIKAIVLDLQNHQGAGVMQDVMTSSKYAGPSPHLYAEGLKMNLADLGYEILRVKIETTPWHPLVPTRANGYEMADYRYFESHVRICTTPTELDKLRNYCMASNAHLSRNILKNNLAGEVAIMATLRVHQGCFEEFQALVTDFVEGLERNLYTVDKLEVEFAIYDSNTSHDADWLSKALVIS